MFFHGGQVGNLRRVGNPPAAPVANRRAACQAVGDERVALTDRDENSARTRLFVFRYLALAFESAPQGLSQFVTQFSIGVFDAESTTRTSRGALRDSNLSPSACKSLKSDSSDAPSRYGM